MVYWDGISFVLDVENVVFGNVYGISVIAIDGKKIKRILYMYIGTADATRHGISSLPPSDFIYKRNYII